MIPILQFDPSSLSIWYDTHLINRMRGGENVGSTIDLALRSQFDSLSKHVESIEDDWVKTRCATVATAVWHEKRHFLDFILTNYGAFRLRQFFMLYCNIYPVLKFAEDTGELLVPLQSYTDSVFCKYMNIKPPTEEILSLALNIKNRKLMIRDDRQIMKSRFPSMEIGGAAILEALAHHFELVGSQLLFGPELLQKVRDDVPDQKLLNRKYQWLYELLASADLIEFVPQDEGPTYIRATALVPICYAALACRLWQQEQVLNEGAYSYLPNYRLASLIPALIPHKELLKKGRIIEVWDVVNNTCREIFGRTCVEEMEADLQCEGQFISSLRDRDPNSLEVRAYSDFHELRERIFQVFLSDPSRILADLEYSLDLSTKLQPIVVVAASGGVIGSPPPDYDRLLGFENSDDKWWWAALSKNWPEIDKKEIFSIKDRRAWIDIISDAAPFAKLLMDGRNVRTILGPELLSAEMRVNYRFKTNIRVHPNYAYPRNPLISENWYYLTGREDFRCDITWETVKRPEGVVIDAWTMRLWPGIIAHLVGGLADQTSFTKTIQRDWSPWILSEDFRELLQETAEDPSLLISTNWSR